MKFKVGIIGLGYVGLTLAIAFARRGMQVIGIEKNKRIYDQLKKNKGHFYEENLNNYLEECNKKFNFKIFRDIKKLKNVDTVFITIGTPILKNRNINNYNLFSICRELRQILEDDSIVALRSTVKINTCEKIKKILNNKKRIHVASCPERTVEGSALKELNTLPAIIGTDSSFAKEKLSKIFKKITRTIVTFNSCNQAELLKLIDNSWRDTRFAFANELARVGEYFNINVLEIINKIKIKYPRSEVAVPGLVAGPCLSKDSHIFRESVKKKIKIPIIYNSRKTNENFPIEMINFLKDQIQFKVNNILICGLAFKGVPKTDDIRGSMAKPIINYTKKIFKKSKIYLFDNLVSLNDCKKINPRMQVFRNYQNIKKKYDLILILNNNPLWRKIGYKKFQKLLRDKQNFIYDFWNSFSIDVDQYKAFGQGKILKN
jgi:UDP-N-acetyl-D-mannosaminuronic acid dehydrogenase